MKKIIISILFSLVTICTFGQDLCRYMFEGKICFEISATKMLVKSDKLSEDDMKKALQNTVAGSLQSIVYLPSNDAYLIEMENTGKENLQKLIYQWSSREDVIFVSPVFLNEYGEDEGGYMNEVVVRLKSNDDYPVLQKSVENYHVIDIKPNKYDELRYYLTFPHNTQQNALSIANELHETGLFEYASANCIIFAKLGGNANPHFPEQWELQNGSSPFTVYPNPANDVLYVDIDQETTLPEYSVAIFNLRGGKALQTATNNNKVSINVSFLQNGIYFLHLYDILSGKQEIRKIVIKH